MRYITNVGRLAQALKHRTDDGLAQLLYYDNGIGADSKGLRRMVEGGFGKGMEDNIAEAYRFICFNYEKGDEICLFGFSRGAYTVRSLAGMIGKAGLVDRMHLKQVPQALEVYRSEDDGSSFRGKYGKTVPIALLGCWDTVGALGIPDKVSWLPFDNWSKRKYEFHDTNLGSHVKRALHAVAIDERREEFDVTLIAQPDNPPADQQLRQVWFPGDHGSVGGGYWEKRGLSNIALRWMVEEAAKLGIELALDFDRLKDKAVCDHAVFFNNSVSFLYGEIDRSLVAKVKDVHESAKLRWKELSEYRPPELKKRFGASLKHWNSAKARQTWRGVKELKVGECVDTRVLASAKNRSAKIKLVKNAVYHIDVAGTQVWKDGPLDPCDIRGWSLKASKPAWSDGAIKEFNTPTRKIISKLKKKCPVPKADFFELIAKIGNGPFTRLSIPAKTNREHAYSFSLTAQQTGELVLAANDVSSDWDIIDKYDNNQGWIWLRVERVS